MVGATKREPDAASGQRAADLIASLASAWAEPSPQGLAAFLAHDAVLIQPSRPVARGVLEAEKELAHLLRCFPGIHARPLHWAGRDECVFVEWLVRTPARRGTLAHTRISSLRPRGAETAVEVE